MTKSEPAYTPNDETDKIRQLIDLLIEMLGVLSARWPLAQYDLRQTFILMHIHRATTQGRLCLTLAESRDLEHIWLVYRPLSELVINAAYLQVVKDEKELERFFHFDWQRMVSQHTKLRKHRPPAVAPPEHLSKGVEALYVFSKRQTGWGDEQRTWSRHNLANRAIETDKHYRVEDFYTLYLSALPYGNAAAHSTMASFHWSANVVGGTASQITELRTQSLWSALHIVFLCLSLLCYAVDEKQELGMISRINQACR